MSLNVPPSGLDRSSSISPFGIGRFDANRDVESVSLADLSVASSHTMSSFSRSDGLKSLFGADLNSFIQRASQNLSEIEV